MSLAALLRRRSRKAQAAGPETRLTTGGPNPRSDRSPARQRVCVCPTSSPRIGRGRDRRRMGRRRRKGGCTTRALGRWQRFRAHCFRRLAIAGRRLDVACGWSCCAGCFFCLGACWNFGSQDAWPWEGEASASCCAAAHGPMPPQTVLPRWHVSWRGPGPPSIGLWAVVRSIRRLAAKGRRMTSACGPDVAGVVMLSFFAHVRCGSSVQRLFESDDKQVITGSMFSRDQRVRASPLMSFTKTSHRAVSLHCVSCQSVAPIRTLLDAPHAGVAAPARARDSQANASGSEGTHHDV